MRAKEGGREGALARPLLRLVAVFAATNAVKEKRVLSSSLVVMADRSDEEGEVSSSRQSDETAATPLHFHARSIPEPESDVKMKSVSECEGGG